MKYHLLAEDWSEGFVYAFYTYLIKIEDLSYCLSFFENKLFVLLFEIVQTASMMHQYNGKNYLLNLIDTPVSNNNFKFPFACIIQNTDVCCHLMKVCDSF